MFGLTTLGIIHTAISLVALAAGLFVLVRDRQISRATGAGRVYVWATALTCLTGFGIFRHGGFGPPHVLGIITLVVLGIAALGESGRFGRLSAYVAVIGYSLTFFFHMIPGATETFTRFPLGAPLFTGPDDPKLQNVIAVFFVLVLIGAALQVRA